MSIPITQAMVQALINQPSNPPVIASSVIAQAVGTIVNQMLQQNPNAQPTISITNVEAFHREFDVISARLHAIDDSITKAATDSRAPMISTVEFALTKLFKVALFVHGEYNSDKGDANSRMVVAQAVAGFEQAKQLVDSAFESAIEMHRTIGEFKEREIVDFINRVEQAVCRIVEERQNWSSRMEALDMQMRQLKEVESVSQRRLDELSRTTENPLFMFAMKEAGFIMYQQLAEARQTFTNARVMTGRCQQEIMLAHHERENLDIAADTMRAVQTHIPQLFDGVNQLTQKMVKMLDGMSHLRETADKLVQGAKYVEAAANIAISCIDNKAAIGISILDICQNALIDKNVTDEVQMIVDELVKGYEGMTMPKSMEEKLAKTREALQTLPLVQTVA